MAQLFSLGITTFMAMSPEMSKLIDGLMAMPRDKFRARMDSESDGFIEEFLAEYPKDGFHRTYVLSVQQSRRHRELVTPHPLVWWAFWISILAIAISFAAWIFPRAPQVPSPPHEAHSQ